MTTQPGSTGLDTMITCSNTAMESSSDMKQQCHGTDKTWGLTSRQAPLHVGVDDASEDEDEILLSHGHAMSANADLHASLVRSPPATSSELQKLSSSGAKCRRGVCRVHLLSGRGLALSNGTVLPNPAVWISLHHHTAGCGGSLSDVAFKAHLMRPQHVSASVTSTTNPG